MNKLIVMMVAAVSAAVAFGETISLTLTKDCTFAEALEAYNTAQSTTYVDTDGGTSLGENDVEFTVEDAETPYKVTFTTMLANWTGKATFKPGTIAHVIINQKDGTAGAYLGSATTGAVYIESGATLLIDGRNGCKADGTKGTDSSAAKTGALKRTVYLSGTGAKGWGGAFVRDSGNSGADRVTTPPTMIMQGDTTFAVVQENKNYHYFFSGFTLDMNEHTLTIQRQSSTAAVWTCVPNSWKIVNPGNIIADGVCMQFRDANWGGSAANKLHLVNGARYNMQGAPSMPKWTLEIDEGCGGELTGMPGQGHGYDGTDNVWNGPMILNGQLLWFGKDGPTSGWNNQPHHVKWGFGGAISGSGSLLISSMWDPEVITNRFILSSANTFTGGVVFTNIYDVVLGSPQSIPSGTGKAPLSVKNSNLRLDYARSAGAFTFPETVFDGAGTIAPSEDKADALYPHTGEFALLTKKGDGVLTVNARLTGGDIAIEGGTVKLAKAPTVAEQRAHLAGLNSGNSSSFSCYGDPFTYNDPKFAVPGFSGMLIKDVFPVVLFTNNTVTSMAIFSTPHGAYDDENSVWRKTFYSKMFTYDGWLNNDSNEDKTIRVICTLNAYVKLTVEDQVFQIGGGVTDERRKNDIKRNMYATDLVNPHGDWTVTLKPGMNRFEVRCYDRYGNSGRIDGDTGKWFCYGNICTNGLSNWDDTHGLMWTTKLDSKDMNDYQRFEDDGTGKTFTKVCEFEDAYQQIDTLSGSGTLDLKGGHAMIGDCQGSVKIVNGTVTYNGKGGMLTLGSGVNAITAVQDATKRRDSVFGLGYGLSAMNNSWYSSMPIEKDTTQYRNLVTNTVVSSAEVFYWPQVQNNWNSVDRRWYRYEGFLWNDGAVDKQIRIVYAANEYYEITVGDQVSGRTKQINKMRTSTATAADKHTFTLKPGANYFRVDSYSRFGGQSVSTVYVGNVATNGLVNWDVEHGLMWSEKLSSVDMNDFAPFAVGSGLTMTRTAGDFEEFAQITAADDSTTTLNGDIATCALNGFGTYTGGKLVIDGNWNLTKAQVENAAYASGLEFTANAKLVISDATMQEIYNDMDASAKVNGYLLATNVTGKPTLVRAAGDKRMKLVLVDGNLYLMVGKGLLVIVK